MRGNLIDNVKPHSNQRRHSGQPVHRLPAARQRFPHDDAARRSSLPYLSHGRHGGSSNTACRAPPSRGSKSSPPPDVLSRRASTNQSAAAAPHQLRIRAAARRAREPNPSARPAYGSSTIANTVRPNCSRRGSPCTGTSRRSSRLLPVGSGTPAAVTTYIASKVPLAQRRPNRRPAPRQ